MRKLWKIYANLVNFVFVWRCPYPRIRWYFAQLFTFFHVCHFSLLWERNLTFASSITTPYFRGVFIWKRKVGGLLVVFMGVFKPNSVYLFIYLLGANQKEHTWQMRTLSIYAKIFMKASFMNISDDINDRVIAKTADGPWDWK